MQYKKMTLELSEGIEKLINNNDEESLKQCARFLKTFIELIVWNQFRSSFIEILFQKNERELYFTFKPEKINIVKMYELIRTHISCYEEMAKNKMVIIALSSSGNAPSREIGKTCAIPISLPTDDYSYLIKIQDLNSINNAEDFEISRSKLLDIYNNILFVRDNSTLPQIRPNKDEDKIDDNFNFIYT